MLLCHTNPQYLGVLLRYIIIFANIYRKYDLTVYPFLRRQFLKASISLDFNFFNINGPN